MKHKTVGYIVLGIDFSQHVAGPMRLCELRDEPKGVLLFGPSATLFATRQQAQAAIKRSSRIFTPKRITAAGW